MDAHNSYNPLYAILDAIPKEGILFDPKLVEFIVLEMAKAGHAYSGALQSLILYLAVEQNLLEFYTDTDNKLFIRKTYGN